MRGVHPSLLIGSQLRALLLNQCACVSSACVSWAFACWNTVRRSKRCSARGRAAAVRETVRLVNDERFRRRGREKLPSRRGRDGWEEPLDDNAKSFRIRDAASVRVERASPAQAQSAAPVRAPPTPPWTSHECGPAATQRDERSGSRRTSPTAVVEQGDARRPAAPSLFVSIIARGTTHCDDSHHTQCHTHV